MRGYTAAVETLKESTTTAAAIMGAELEKSATLVLSHGNIFTAQSHLVKKYLNGGRA